MPVIIALALAVIVIIAVIVVSSVVHLLFSPWLLVLGVAILAWIKFRPHHTSR